MSHQEKSVEALFQDQEFVTFLGWFWSNLQIEGLDSIITRERKQNDFIQTYELAAVKIALELLSLRDRDDAEGYEDEEVSFWGEFINHLLASSLVQENEQLQSLTVIDMWLLTTALSNYMELGEEVLQQYSVIRLKGSRSF